MNRITNLLIAVIVACSLTACNSSKTLRDDSAYIGLNAEQIYAKAEKNLKNGRYDKALEDFEALEARYPFGEYGAKAQLGTIYAYYKDGEPESALPAAERFIQVFPTHSEIDYAYYMKGLINYGDMYGFFARYLPLDPALRDVSNAHAAFQDFSTLIKRFPNSKYAPDAKKRMVHLRNIIARHEVAVAQYYFKRGAYLAAANRANYVVTHFQQTSEVPAALKIMEKSYKKLDMHDLATVARQNLDSNFPDYRG